MASEGLKSRMSEPKGASALLRLRLPEDVAGTFACERPSHPYSGIFEVNVRPLESEQLSTPHTGVNCEHVQGFEPVATGRLKELACFEGGQRSRAHSDTTPVSGSRHASKSRRA